MKVLSLSCMALAIAEEAPSNRTLLNARRLADGRRLAVVKCEIEVYPNAYGKGASTSVAYGAATNTHACDTATPAVVVTGATSGTGSVEDGGTETAVKSACCKAAPLCSVSYADHGGSTTNKIAACPTTGNKVPADLTCYTTDGATSAAKCGSGTADHSSDLDKAHCCRQMCNDATGGFETAAASTTLQDCPANAGTFQVSSTAYCAGSACATSTDDAVCCQKKCTNGFVLFGVTKVSTNFNDQNCADGADRVHPTKYCAGKTCASTDASTCCQNKCTDGYVKFTASPPTGKRACATGLRVSPDAYCSGPTCASTDDATCCETKCDKSGAGFELNGQTTTGMQQCAADLAVHPTEYCDGTSCSASAAVCCQQKCTKGFKLSGATGSGIACKKDDSIHTTAHCKGSTCLDTDAATCCNQMCKDKSYGFKPSILATRTARGCAKGETVASNLFCNGDCSADDASQCCLKQNNTGSVSSAKSSGLASLVAGLLFIAAAAK